MLEIALDLVLLPHPEDVACFCAPREVSTESIGEHVVAAERDLSDLSGDRQTARRAVADERVVIVAAAELRVETNRLTSDSAPRDLLRSGLHARRNRHERPDPTRVHDRPFQRLHAAHRTADDRHPARHLQMLSEPGLCSHHVANRDHREA